MNTIWKRITAGWAGLRAKEMLNTFAKLSTPALLLSMELTWVIVLIVMLTLWIH